jgi:hypothetical protein
MSFELQPTSIKQEGGFNYQTKGGLYKIALEAQSDMEFAATLGVALSQGGVLFAADPHYIGNALTSILLIEAGYSTEQICPSTPRAPSAGEVEFGDFVLLKKDAEGAVENVGIVFEVKSTRYHINAFVIDSHGLAPSWTTSTTCF